MLYADGAQIVSQLSFRSLSTNNFISIILILIFYFLAFQNTPICLKKKVASICETYSVNALARNSNILVGRTTIRHVNGDSSFIFMVKSKTGLLHKYSNSINSAQIK